MQQALWLLSKLTPLAVLDILLVTLIFYGLLMLIRGTQADQLVRGVLILLLASAFIGSFLNLTIFNWLLQNTIPALLIAIPVIFQPEIRRALEQLGRTGAIINYPLLRHSTTSVEKLAEEVARAAALLAERGYGGLIVIERSTGLEEYAQTGIRIDSIVAGELLLQIFYKGSPLHDGAVIIRGDRIIAARCLLPLTDIPDLDPELGTRHRAAIGVTEHSDAICVVVSEETGAISLAKSAHLVRHLNEQKLALLLTALLQTPTGLPDRPGQLDSVKPKATPVRAGSPAPPPAAGGKSGATGKATVDGEAGRAGKGRVDGVAGVATRMAAGAGAGASAAAGAAGGRSASSAVLPAAEASTREPDEAEARSASSGLWRFISQVSRKAGRAA